jgi:muconate cycloisomerase
MGVLLMACESAAALEDVQRISALGHYGLFNLKLSRSGGFHRTLGILDHLRAEGISFQIGCHLGESGLLSAAGRALGLASRDALYFDGSYDPFLLLENITAEDVTFGRGGEAGPLNGPGLGVRVDQDRLRRLGSTSPVLCIQRP